MVQNVWLSEMQFKIEYFEKIYHWSMAEVQTTPTT